MFVATVRYGYAGGTGCATGGARVEIKAKTQNPSMTHVPSGIRGPTYHPQRIAKIHRRLDLLEARKQRSMWRTAYSSGRQLESNRAFFPFASPCTICIQTLVLRARILNKQCLKMVEIVSGHQVSSFIYKIPYNALKGMNVTQIPSKLTETNRQAHLLNTTVHNLRRESLCNDTHRSLLKTAPDRRAWDLVAFESRVNVDQDAWVVLLVEGRAVFAARARQAWMLVTIAGDLEVDAHWIVLSAIDSSCRVQGDDLVAEDEVAGDAARDGQGPGVVVLCRWEC